MEDLLARYRENHEQDNGTDLLEQYRQKQTNNSLSQPSLARDLGNLALQGISNVGGTVGYALE